MFFRVRKHKSDQGFTSRTISARLRLYYHNERNHTESLEEQHNEVRKELHSNRQ